MRTSVFLAIALLSIAAGAQTPDFSKIDIKATRVAGQVFVLESTGPEFSGGNVGVSVGPDGILLVDDKFAPLAPKIQAALKGISDKPVRFVINTHFHGDHTNGNEVFGPISTVIAHENTRKRMAAGRGKDSPPAPPPALPILTFEDSLGVHVNGEEIRAIHMPSGHTDTDVVVFFTKSNVVHLGDDFFNGVFPFIDVDAGGSTKGLISNIEKLLGQIPPDAKIIPGHGPVATTKELRAFLAMLKDTSAIVSAGIAAGKSVDQLKKEKVLSKYDGWKWLMGTDDYIDQLYRELGKK